MSDVQVLVISNDTDTTILGVDTQTEVEALEVLSMGPQGPPGQGVFVGPTAPVNPTGEYVWFQTGIGPNGDITMWVEDGS